MRVCGLLGLAFGALILSLRLVSSCGYLALKTYTIGLGPRMGQANWDFRPDHHSHIERASQRHPDLPRWAVKALATR
jgi:hypothetical protein